jgi:hypothetical protein
MFEDNFLERENIWSYVPDSGLRAVLTGRLTVGRKITLTLLLVSEIEIRSINWYIFHHSVVLCIFHFW